MRPYNNDGNGFGQMMTDPLLAFRYHDATYQVPAGENKKSV